jgi:MarR-like DNA-binding transcriptional regulator SgrR of sgrS sRNA
MVSVFDTIGYFKGIIMTDVTKNYNQDDEAKLINDYRDNPTRETVEKLASQMGKSTRSITAKLSQLKVYKKIERKTKTGNPVISKMDLVKIINEHYNLEMPSLVKATKDDLEKLVTNL